MYELFRTLYRIKRFSWGLFYEPPVFEIGKNALSVKEFPVGNTLLVPVGKLYVRDIRVINTLDVPFPPQREGFIIPAESEDGLPVVQVVSDGEVVALAGQGFLIFDLITSSRHDKDILSILSKALSLAKNVSTAAMLC
ncbi:MAG: hypothetical protein JHC25_01425 [Thermodesulfobacterium sp.]|jgi:hypothetical protein|nr:hypothetical protein [Thermodesulfobacterium sp.]